MHAPYQRSLAHIATVPGGRRKGINTFLRSPRQCRKAFEKEAIALAKAFEASHPGFPKPQTLEEREGLRADHPHFATFCDKLDRLAAMWGQ